MKIIFYTSGVSGSGRVVLGISIGNADSFEKILANILSYPLFQQLDWKIKPLMDGIKVINILY